MTGSREFDLVVIGAGSGGVRAARVASELGARVAVVESGRFGGTCVNLGCIPKKLLVYGAEFAGDLADARGFGWDATTSGCDWATLIARKDGEVARLNAVYRGLLEAAGVEIVLGRARLAGAHAVQVGARTLSCEHVLLSTGSSPIVPDLPGREHAITSDQAFHLPALPHRITIVGGGYVALEFASIFHGLGARVQLVHRGAQILGEFDRDLGAQLTDELAKRGIALRCGTALRSIARSDGALGVELDDGSTVVSDAVLFGTGRRPNTHDVGLAQAGVRLDEGGAVAIDAYGRSSAANIFAVGDCTGGPGLTPVAIADGQAVAHTLFGAAPRRVSERDHVPTAIFSQPPVATVGLSEGEARARGLEIDVYRSRFTPLKHRLSGRSAQSLVKLVVERASQRVLGFHMVGEGAPEIMQGFAVALRCGVTKAVLDATLGIHPTAAEELVTLRAPATPDA